MLRVVRVDHERAGGEAADSVLLDSSERRRRRIVLTGEKGTRFLLDFPEPVTLHDGDVLELDDASMILVRGAPEELLEISAPSPLAFLRLAWHIGNRHAELQVAGDRLRIRHDHVLEEMVRGLGGDIAAIAAPFDPEPA
jgi:urease accessory protein